jgi:NAD-dependent aldehyde dehydrogenases
MKIFCSVTFILLFSLTSCNNNRIAEFNQAIVSSRAHTVSVHSNFEYKLKTAMWANSYSDFEKEVDISLAKIDMDIEAVKYLKVPEGGERYKETALIAFDAAKDAIEAARKITKITDSLSAEEKNAILERYNEILEKYNEKDNDLVQAQSEFARAKGLKM